MSSPLIDDFLGRYYGDQFVSTWSPKCFSALGRGPQMKRPQNLAKITHL